MCHFIVEFSTVLAHSEAYAVCTRHRASYCVVTREGALSVPDTCRMPRATAVDAKNMYERSITLSLDVSKLGLLWLLWRGVQPVAVAT